VGSVGNGWQVVMYLLQFERGAYAWKRQAELHTQLAELIAALPSNASESGANDSTANAVGNAYLSVFALRSQCSPTFATLNSGVDLGPGISIDKILLSTCEQTMTDCARSLLWPALEVDDSALATMWARRWTFSRITTIYGGAGEVQRDLVAERLLGLPRGR
jgi:alkylation response protein AidB-like acyl-CoA dehydrogenase